MKKTKVTFESEDGKKKAVIDISFENDEMTVAMEFEPTIKGNSKELYGVLAMEFINYLQNMD